MNNIITRSEIQHGDKIKVTITDTSYEDRPTSRTYEGVADSNVMGVWRTEKGWNLYAHETGAVVELLDRPKPKIVLPTNTFAQVTYTRNDAERFAVLTPHGKWKAYNRLGDWQDTKSPESMTWLANESEQVSDFKVIFEGVAK